MGFKTFKKKYISYDKENPADKNLLLAFFALLILGLFFLTSASAVLSYQKAGYAYYFLIKQIPPLIVGLGAFYFFYKIDYRYFKKVAFLSLIASIVLLILVFIPGLGFEVGGSTRWVSIFGQSFQPTELVKLTFLIYLATWLESKKGDLKNFGSGTFPFILIVIIISALIMGQPDFGTLTIILISAIAAFFVGGGNYKHLFLLFLMVAILVSSFAYSRVKSSGEDSHMRKRVDCYLDPSYDRKDDCYQINQSLIAVGSGGLLGRGLGESRQKFLFLPEVSGDAIFPIIAEEIGFLFSLLLILLYLYIFYRAYKTAYYTPDIYGRALAVGIIVWLAIQTFFNIGGMINLIPMTGTTLPFVSHGGSSLIASMAAMGILINISRYKINSNNYARK
jgi:cell division protein FtsW